MNTPDYDSPWKELLDDFFEEFMHFFFPDAHAKIDWTRGYEFLDKELQAITADAAIGRRAVDKLVKVWLLDGREAWALIHCEVQGEREVVFEERIYVYRNRIRERYNAPVASFAVLTDDAPDWHPNEFREEILGTTATLKFTSAKMLDYRNDWDALEQHPSIFAIVVMATLKVIETKGDFRERAAWKLTLTQMLYQRGYTRKVVVDLFRFLDWMIWVPKDLQMEYRNAVYKIEEERKMPYVTWFEHYGREQGMQQGMQQGSAGLALRLLKRRFGLLDEVTQSQINSLPVEKIEQLGDSLLDFKSLGDLQNWLQTHGSEIAPVNN